MPFSLKITRSLLPHDAHRLRAWFISANAADVVRPANDERLFSGRVPCPALPGMPGVQNKNPVYFVPLAQPQDSDQYPRLDFLFPCSWPDSILENSTGSLFHANMFFRPPGCVLNRCYGKSSPGATPVRGSNHPTSEVVRKQVNRFLGAFRDTTIPKQGKAPTFPLEPPNRIGVQDILRFD